ncbi:MAG TPA: 1-acyl-sn-glycerol-3-phosphate acyltransferase [Thermoanaerobaculia bacterium]|jgi:glycerol-3-phosphate O-acyltransferase|nr:1-acyl-sn-glycerol-3-phosphate acyltransferase [Thermoanaerobaculia bacterium]
MSRLVSLPLWLAAVLVLLAAWAALDRLLVPGARWYLRRRVNRVIDELNTRLRLEIPPFHRTRRQVLIDRLVYDPKVIQAVDEQAREQGVPRAVLASRVKRYAREIVPAFNAYFYFRIGYWLSKRVARLLYRVRLGFSDEEGLAGVASGSTVVFLMNHRSNMDYVLVSYLAADQTALSYAVGEWARIWPLQTLIRSTGAYFVRRNSGDPLYRRVLERYIYMATSAGVPQAVYPEGGLSRDGRLRPPKLGILDYMLRSFDPHLGERDLVFIPVGINYDRVLEDRTLLLDLAPGKQHRGPLFAASTTLRFVLRNLVLALRSRWHRFGYACVNFGSPISMRRYLGERGLDLRPLSREERSAHLERLGAELMASIGGVIPVLPVPLVATVLVNAGAPLSELELKARAHDLITELEAAGAHVYIPRRDQDYAIVAGLRMLMLRHLVEEKDGLYAAKPEEMTLLRYYANSIGHLVTERHDDEEA